MKRTASVFCSLALFSALLLFTACGAQTAATPPTPSESSPSEPAAPAADVCTAHIFGEWQTSAEPTCLVEGQQIRACTVCGQTETAALPRSAHSPAVLPGVKPTDSASGKTDGAVCSVCGEILTAQEELPRLPSEAEAEKLKSTMNTAAGLFCYRAENAAALDPATVLSFYIAEQDIRGLEMYPGGITEQENAILKDGWVCDTTDPLWYQYNRTIPMQEFDAWCLSRFGMTYNFAPEVSLGINCVYGAKIDRDAGNLLLCTYLAGRGGGPEIWEDFYSYDGAFGQEDDYTVTFRYLLNTVTQPASTDGLESYEIYLCDYGPFQEWSLSPISDTFGTVTQQTVWKLPCLLVFRFNGEAFQFVSFAA